MRPRRAILGVVLGRRFDGNVCVVNGAASTIGEAVTLRLDEVDPVRRLTRFALA